MQTNKIYTEPCLETLRKMPDEFIDCVITSPPYWQLRDYGYDGQWGLEPTFQQYLEHLWEMMDEIWRVLKPTGTVWINLGDTYNGTGGGHNISEKRESYKKYNENLKPAPNGKNVKDIRSKCLLLLPHRFAIGCIDRGWILRNDIIWAKRNGMPESVTDRFSKKHEFFFFMTKNEKYFFDLDSVRDKVKAESLKRYEYEFSGNKGGVDRDKIGYTDGDKSHLIPKSKYGTLEIEADHRQGMNKDRGNNTIEKRPNLPIQKEFVEFIRNVKMQDLIDNIDVEKTTIEHWYRKDESGFSYPSVEHWKKIKEYFVNHFINLGNDTYIIYEMDEKMSYVEYETDDINKNSVKGKNCGDVADFWDRKPYAVIDEKFRNEIVYFRELPSQEELRNYLSESRKNKGITIQEIEDIFGTQAPHHWFEKNGSFPDENDWVKLKQILELDYTYDEQMTTIYEKSGLKENNPKGKNCGDVSDFWDVPTKGSSSEHYASYNDALIRKPVLAGCPEFVCNSCGKPREKIIKRTGKTTTQISKELGSTEKMVNGGEKVLQNLDYKGGHGDNLPNYEVTGLTDCGCNAGFTNGIIYDPFMGTGSTAEVSLRANRRFIGSEMSEKYSKIANKRLNAILSQQKLF